MVAIAAAGSKGNVLPFRTDGIRSGFPSGISRSELTIGIFSPAVHLFGLQDTTGVTPTNCNGLEVHAVLYGFGGQCIGVGPVSNLTIRVPPPAV